MNTAQNAQHLAAKGRYGDTMLVHMSPKEVGGLQALARSNGTTLTVNPHTGLPEAFSLGRLLPMIGGAALTAMSGGTLSPLTIGLMTGGIGALATGSLKEGLMMGLGAAGGAGLAGSMANLAAPTIGAAVPEAAVVGAPNAMAGAGSGVTVPAAAVNTAAPTSLINSAAMPKVGMTIPANTLTLPELSTASLPPPAPLTPPVSGPMTLDPAVYGRPFDANITKVFPGNGITDAMPNAYTIGEPGLSTNYPFSQAKLMAQAQQPILGGSAYQSVPGPNGTINVVNGPIDAAERGALRLNALASQPISSASAPSTVLPPAGSAPLPKEIVAGEAYLKPPTQVVEATSLNTPKPYTERLTQGFGRAFGSPEAAGSFLSDNKMNLAMSAAPAIFEDRKQETPESESYIRPYDLTIENTSNLPASRTGVEDQRLRYRYTAREPYRAAQGGIVAFARGGQNQEDPEGMMLPDMGRFDATMQPNVLPRLDQQRPQGYAEGGHAKGRKKIDRMDDPYTFAAYQSGRGLYDAAVQNFAQGGIGGQPRFLSGGGDGMSDSIPATINGRDPARLADGEFVVPADVVSHLGNGSSKAGAQQLYAMMDRVRQKRTGKKRQAPQMNPKKMMPA